MRKHLAEDFDAIYILDLGGSVRRNPKLSGTTHNVFGIQVGVSITFFVKKRDEAISQTGLFYARVDEFWRKEEKYRYLDDMEQYGNVEWQRITPDKRHTWLTEGLQTEFETFMPMGSKEAKATRGEAAEVLFHTFSNGVKTNRDAWAYNFSRRTLSENINRMIDSYNEQVFKWERSGNHVTDVDDFVFYDDQKISWSRDLKAKLKRGRLAEYFEHKVRDSIYRPFIKSNIYFDRVIERCSVRLSIHLPHAGDRKRKPGIGCSRCWRTSFLWCLCTGIIPNLALTSIDASQCFPFYIYDEDGSNRRENITAWALDRFRAHYRDDTISKWDIFHYVYGLLHHPAYRERYQANLKRELPRIPFAPDFHAFADAGARLGHIHVGYEEQPQYPLAQIETPNMPLDWRVEKMRLSKDKTQLLYNRFLTLDGIPAAAFDYRLGNRSALDWIIDQYRVKTDKRSGIVNDPNRADDPQYIVGLIGKVISLSLETVQIVGALPALGVGEKESVAAGQHRQ